MAAHLKFATLILALGLLVGACSGDGGREPDLSSDVDTSDWLHHRSPLGFELWYPPDWTLDVVSDGQLRILNTAYREALDAALDAAVADGLSDVELPPTPGASQFSVIADIAPGFDVDSLVDSCGGEALQTTFLDRDAVYCPGQEFATDRLTSAGHSYWVEFPPGHTMLVGGSATSEGAPDLVIIEAMLQFFAFTSAP